MKHVQELVVRLRLDVTLNVDGSVADEVFSCLLLDDFCNEFAFPLCATVLLDLGALRSSTQMVVSSDVDYDVAVIVPEAKRPSWLRKRDSSPITDYEHDHFWKDADKAIFTFLGVGEHRLKIRFS